MDIHRSSLRNYIIPNVKSVYVVDYFERIQSQLNAREDFPYKNFLAKPRVRTKTEIIWCSDVFSVQPGSMAEQDEIQRSYYALLLNERVSSFELLIRSLRNEEGGDALADILEKCLSFIDEESVYCGEDEIVIVNWGLVPRRQGPESLGIYSGGKYLGHWDYLRNESGEKYISQDAPDQCPPQEDEYVDKEDSVIQEPDTQTEAPAQNLNSDGFVPSENKERSMEEQLDIVYQEGTVVENNNTQEEGSETKDEIISEKTRGEQIQIKDGNKLDRSQKQSKCYWYRLRNICRCFFAFLLILLLLMFLLKDCQGPIHLWNPFYNPLPDHATILPIDSASIGYGKDSVNQILQDRLNILLKKERGATLQDFARRFKEVYDGDEYRVIYYDENTYRLQIKIPKEERETIKEELPLKIKEFSFIVFDEMIFGNNVTFNDPALKQEDYSWYLKAIQAYDAWGVTTGSKDVIVAVVDNGFDLRHPEISSRIYKPYNVLSKDGTLHPVDLGDEGKMAHGTHVASTAVGEKNNNEGLLGIAPGCKLMPVQVANDKGYITTTSIMDGILYAIYQGADVVNVSLGTILDERLVNMSEGQQLNYISNTGKSEEEVWDYIFNIADERNCTIVLAAGNDNVISGMDTSKRSDKTIRVSALDQNLVKAEFSNYGNYKELNREYSTISAPGVRIFSAAPSNSYLVLQGTSMASPIVAGSVALMKSLDRSLTTPRIIEILQQTGRPVEKGETGNMLQLYDALLAVQGKSRTVPPVDCGDVAKRIKALEDELTKLRKLCPNSLMEVDTLKYQDAIKDPKALDGLWKSTSNLCSTEDASPIELYMSFNDSKGELLIHNKGVEYKAALTARIEGDKIFIRQHGPAVGPANNNFIPYNYECKSDQLGNFVCVAKNSMFNYVEFNLVRVN